MAETLDKEQEYMNIYYIIMVAPLGHIILIPSQPVFALSP
jgi:hypothetical protein